MVIDLTPQTAKLRCKSTPNARQNVTKKARPDESSNTGLTDTYQTTDAVLARAAQLDALDAILPFVRREKLAEILTDDDVATLKHLANQGLGANSLRALASDLAYIEAWALASTGKSLPWPAPEALLIKFIAHHLWDAHQRQTDPNHGMPDAVTHWLQSNGLLRKSGPHAPATVRRRLSSWSTLTQWRGFVGVFNAPSLRTALKLSVRASATVRHRKSQKAVTGDVLQQLLRSIGTEKLTDLRDRALLLTAFASGGRRRSELANLRVEDIVREEPVPVDPNDAQSRKLTCLTLRLGRTKTTSLEDQATALLIGTPADALLLWLARAGIAFGPAFRAIDQWGNLRPRALDAQSVNLILKTRVKAAGLDPTAFSAHGLRSGYLTEAARQGIPLPEAMAQSGHKSVQQAANYYNDENRKMGRAARLVV
jgi:integrase